MTARSGLAGPYAVGWLKDSTGSYQTGLYFLATCAFLSAVIAFFTINRLSAAKK